MADAERNTYTAILRGIMCRCPSCGHSGLFDGFLVTRERCANCSELLSGHRADDFPPYIVIFIVGHIIVGLVMWVEELWDLSVLTHILLWVPLIILFSVGLLRPVKGGVIGLQWALRLHGFGDDEHTEESDDG